MDLCGDETRTVTSPTHLAYFHRVTQNPVQNCTCVVQGGDHRLKAVDVHILPSNNSFCASASLRVGWSVGSGTRSIQITSRWPLANEYLFNTAGITWIDYTRNCSLLAQIVWFTVEPVDGSQPTIYCESSIQNGPRGQGITERDFTHESSNPVTPSEQSTAGCPSGTGCREDARSSDTAIVGGVLGSIIFLGLTGAVAWVLWRRNHPNQRESNKGANGVASNSTQEDPSHPTALQTFTPRADESAYLTPVHLNMTSPASHGAASHYENTQPESPTAFPHQNNTPASQSAYENSPVYYSSSDQSEQPTSYASLEAANDNPTPVYTALALSNQKSEPEYTNTM